MLPKSLSLSFLLVLFTSAPSFAEVVEVSTDEPLSEDVGMVIDLQGRDFVESIPIAPGRFISVDKGLTDVRVIKDKLTGFNKFYALVPYKLHVENARPSFTRFLYVQCPVIRKTYIDRSPPPKEKLIDGEMVTVFYADKINHKVLNKEFLDLGSYSFLSSPERPVPRLSNDFSMVGKVHQFLPIEAMCLDIRLAYSEYRWSKSYRAVILKNFGISE